MNNIIFLIFTASFFNVMAQLSLKILAGKIRLSFTLESLYLVVFNKFFLIGITFYIISLFLSIKIFETAKFSYVVPMFIAFVFIFTFIISIFIFKEQITFIKLFGICLILMGIYLIS